VAGLRVVGLVEAVHAFAALPPPAQAALEQDLVDLIGRFNRANDGTVVVPSEYLEVVVLRR
jgi:hypothetical protein